MLVSSKGQVSVETLVAVFAVIVFFIIVLVQASFINNSASLIESSFSEKDSCLKLSSLLSQVYSEGKGSSIIASLNHPATIFGEQKIIFVGEQMCYFIAITNDKNLLPGEVRIFNDGEVGVEQI